MQKFKTKLKPFLLVPPASTIAYFCLTFLIVVNMGVTVFAQYDSGAYGSCSYSEPCTSANAESLPPRTPGYNAAENPGLSPFDRVKLLITKLPEGTQRALPFYMWLIMVLLALVLLIQALIDRRRMAKLAKVVSRLKSALQQQKNFIYLVLHNLNTPLAVSKNTLEMLEQAKSSEANAVHELKPAIMGLATTVDYATSEVAKENHQALSFTGKSMAGTSLAGTVSKWYFIVPMLAAGCLGVFINLAINGAGTKVPQFYLLSQVVTGIVVALIFANSLRVITATKKQHDAYQATEEIASQLTTERKQVIRAVSNSLDGIVVSLKTGKQQIKDTKLAQSLQSGLTMLEKIAYKTGFVTQQQLSIPEAVEVRRLLNELIQKQELLAKDKNVTISIKSTPNRALLLHRSELRFVLDSLIDNAIRYNKSGGVVEIIAGFKDNHLQLQVRDNGVGLSQEEQANLFEPFSKSGDVLTDTSGGMGLSLYICREIIWKMGGAISVSSVKNENTNVEVALPVSIATV